MSTTGTCHAPLRLDVVVEPDAAPSSVLALERAGFGGAWVTETVRDPFLVLAAMADRTTGLDLATGLAVAFARSPMTLALTAHDLQRASRGRFVLGLGSQVRAHVTRRFSMPWSRPAERMREYVLALRAIWAAWNDGVPLDFSGVFYEHTLMTPFFDPGPTGFGPPPVLLGGVGPRMTRVAGEVADGFVGAPLTTVRSFAEQTVPALRDGWAQRGGRPAGFRVCAMSFVVTGETPARTAQVAGATRSRIAFYASTPAYRAVLDLHGWGAAAEELTRLSKAGRWAEMASVVDDTMLDAFAVVAPPDELEAALHARWGGAVDRVALYTAADPGPRAWAAVRRGVARR